jgi:hypothetical protein
MLSKTADRAYSLVEYVYFMPVHNHTMQKKHNKVLGEMRMGKPLITPPTLLTWHLTTSISSQE